MNFVIAQRQAVAFSDFQHSHKFSTQPEISETSRRKPVIPSQLIYRLRNSSRRFLGPLKPVSVYFASIQDGSEVEAPLGFVVLCGDLAMIFRWIMSWADEDAQMYALASDRRLYLFLLLFLFSEGFLRSVSKYSP